jgi:hypothetical protein
MKALIQEILMLQCMDESAMNCMFRSSQCTWGLICHSHSSFILESMLTRVCVGMTERSLSWLSNTGTSRTMRSELKAHKGVKCWDFQASICLVLLSFYYGSLILWRATGLDGSPLFTDFHQDYFQWDWIV